MNYEILIPIWSYFGTDITHPEYSSTEFMYRINKVLTDYPKNILKVMYNLIDSHDTSRIMAICSNNVNLVKLPYLFLFAFPGAPSVFYGSEIGLAGKHDPENRACMIWDEKDQNLDLLNHIKKLIKLRAKYKAFKSTDFDWIETNDVSEYIIFRKADLYFIMTKRYKPQTIVLPSVLQKTTVKDIYNNKVITLSTSLDLGSYGFYILKKK
jgi:glycosidase